jgi:hypothetical protein
MPGPTADDPLADQADPFVLLQQAPVGLFPARLSRHLNEAARVDYTEMFIREKSELFLMVIRMSYQWVFSYSLTYARQPLAQFAEAPVWNAGREQPPELWGNVP